jgi:hypothetical protein
MEKTMHDDMVDAIMAAFKVTPAEIGIAPRTGLGRSQTHIPYGTVMRRRVADGVFGYDLYRYGMALGVGTVIVDFDSAAGPYDIGPAIGSGGWEIDPTADTPK